MHNFDIEAVASPDQPPPPPDGLTRQVDTGGNGNCGKRRRNLLWECFSSNAFKSRRGKHKELTEQLQHEEIGASAPYTQASGPQSANLPAPNFANNRLQRHEQPLNSSTTDAPRSHPRDTSVSSSDSVLRNNNNSSNRLLSSQQEEGAAGSSRLNQFMAELKFLFKDLIEYSKAKTWKKKILTVVVGIISALVFYDLLFGKQDFIVTWLRSFIVWMTTHHAAAVFAFVGIFVVSTLAFVPPTLLVFGAGYAFTMAMENVPVGVTAATISCFMGSCIGAVIAFVRSRYMMRDLVKLFANRYPLIRAIDRVLKVNHGFWIMLLLRLCPIIPFSGLNYCCGITGVTLNDFILSLVGILPFQIYTIILGATAGAIELRDLEINEFARTERWALIGFIIVGVLLGIIAIVQVWRIVKDQLRRELSLSPEEFEAVIHSDRDISSFLPYPQEGGPSFHEMDNTSIRSSEGLTAFQGEGEEWFWIWA